MATPAVGLSKWLSGQRAFDPVISPDGRMIAYVAETAEGRVDVFLTDPRGEGRVRLTDDDAREESPRFSPGRKPAGVRPSTARRDESGHSGSSRYGGQVTPVVARADFPAWSPDGTRLVFTYRPDPPEPVALATVNADGSDLKILSITDGAFPFMRAPSWSPDGKEIAFIRGSGGFSGEIWTISASGGMLRRLSNDAAAVFSDEPVFTPDGRAVVHSSNRGGATNIWLMPLSGGPPVRLTTGSGPDDSPSIALDGTIAFSNSRSRNTLLVHSLATGKTRTLLTHSGFLWGPAFSPDGRQVAYSQGEVDGSWHLWVMPAEGESVPSRFTSTLHGSSTPVTCRMAVSRLFFKTGTSRANIWQVASVGGSPVTAPTYRPTSRRHLRRYVIRWRGAAFVRPEAQAEYVYAAHGGGAAAPLHEDPGWMPR